MAAIGPVQTQTGRTAQNHPENMKGIYALEIPQVQPKDGVEPPTEGQLWPRGEKLGT